MKTPAITSVATVVSHLASGEPGVCTISVTP
jgi:hypothetical protein